MRPKILIQFDTDPHPSVFDAVVAADSGVDHLLQYGGVAAERVRDLVYGAMFTRGPDDLHNTAIFLGGSDVAAGEALLQQVTKCFFGTMRVSVLFDANGANTTAAAAVLAASKHVELSQATVLVLAATGPVGQRTVRLLAGQGARVRVASRNVERAEQVCQRTASRLTRARLEPLETRSEADLTAALQDVSVVIAAGAAGVQILPKSVSSKTRDLRVVVDLNAVPPTGIEGVDASDRARDRDGIICYGAIGVGATKMKIHKQAIRKLFTSNDLVLDAEEVFALGRDIA